MSDLLPPPDSRKTLMRVLAVLGMLLIAVSGLLFSAYMIWTGK
jgi:hypothetical protein